MSNIQHLYLSLPVASSALLARNLALDFLCYPLERCSTTVLIPMPVEMGVGRSLVCFDYPQSPFPFPVLSLLTYFGILQGSFSLCFRT